MNAPVDIIVSRFPSALDWTLSEYFISGARRGVGVEDEARTKKVHGETRIPNGIYQIGFTHSPKFSGSYFVDANGYLNKQQNERFNEPHLMVTVLNVPNFDRILWHWGNTDDDTDGCYIVGDYFGPVNTKNGVQQGVLDSRINYVKNYPRLIQLFRKNEAEGRKTFVQYKERD